MRSSKMYLKYPSEAVPGAHTNYHLLCGYVYPRLAIKQNSRELCFIDDIHTLVLGCKNLLM